MLKFKTSCAVLAYLSSNLLNEVGLSLFRYFEVGLRVCDIVVKKFTFAISSPDEFLFNERRHKEPEDHKHAVNNNNVQMNNIDRYIQINQIQTTKYSTKIYKHYIQ